MLDDKQKDALRCWYARPEIVEKARALHQENRWEELEEHVNMQSLMPIGNVDALPDYMRQEDGKSLFPTNLNPKKDLEGWQDAVEVGWEVMEREIGVSQELLHRNIARGQDDDWSAFMKSVEARKKERGLE
jgi:hypothetical protein